MMVFDLMATSLISGGAGDFLLLRPNGGGNHTLPGYTFHAPVTL